MAHYKEKTGKPRKKKHPVRNKFIAAVAAAVAVFLVILLFYLLLGSRPASEFLGDSIFWLLWGVVYGCLVIAFLLLYKVDATGVVMEENDLDDTDWWTVKEIRTDEEARAFKICNFSNLSKVTDGTVISAEKIGKKDVRIVITKELHSLIVGTSGTGKTTGFVDQNIAILSCTKKPPSMIISDPKGELYLKHSMALKRRGYNVMILDLRDPYKSIRWNPFMPLQTRVVEIRKINEWLDELPFMPDGEVPDREQAEIDAQVRKQVLMDQIESHSKEVISNLCPIKNKDQQSWEQGARDLLQGFLLALCEDAIAGKISVDKIILFNLYQNITTYCNEDTTMLKMYLLEGRDEFSKVKGLANTVLVTSDRTLTSYLTDVNAYMQQLADSGILSLTSDAELNPLDIDERPTAIFIGVPDELKARHGFVTLFVSQAYKQLTEKAELNLNLGATKDKELKRHVYFILDEFGNIPQLADFGDMISVGRSMGFRFLLVLQSLVQLENVYGKNVADVAKNNCNVKVFIGTDDAETKKEFSSLCGNRMIKSLSVNTSVSGDPSSSISVREVPLITEAQLQRLNGRSQGDAIVVVRGFRAIWGTLTPSYDRYMKRLYFPEAGKDGDTRHQRMFKRNELFVDIADILPEQPLTEDEKKLREEYEKNMNEFLDEWEANMKKDDEEIFPYDEEEAGFVSEEDEEFIRELQSEYEVEEEPDDDDIPPTYDDVLLMEFPELAK